MGHWLPWRRGARLRALAEQITRGARGPHHKASLIQEYLRKNLAGSGRFKIKRAEQGNLYEF